MRRTIFALLLSALSLIGTDAGAVAGIGPILGSTAGPPGSPTALWQSSGASLVGSCASTWTDSIHGYVLSTATSEGGSCSQISAGTINGRPAVRWGGDGSTSVRMHDNTLSLGALLSQPAWTIGAIWQYTGPIASGSDYVQGPQITGATGQGGTPTLGIFARAGADGTTLHAYGQLVVMAGTFHQDIDIAGAAHTSHYSVQWFDGTKIRYQVDGGPMDDSTPPAGAFDPTSYADWGVGMGNPLGSNSAWVGSIALVITYNTTLPATLNSWLKSQGGF